MKTNNHLIVRTAINFISIALSENKNNLPMVSFAGKAGFNYSQVKIDAGVDAFKHIDLGINVSGDDQVYWDYANIQIINNSIVVSTDVSEIIIEDSNPRDAAMTAFKLLKDRK